MYVFQSEFLNWFDRQKTLGRPRKRWGYKYGMKLEQAWNVLYPITADDDEK
jgi:hypothetical protein